MDTKTSNRPLFDTKTYMFSVSSMKEFEQCGVKFKFGRVEKLEKDPESTHHRWLGKVVHASIYSSIGRMNLAEGFKSWEKTKEHGYEIDATASLAFFSACWDGTDDEYLTQAIALEAGPKPTGRFLRQKKKKSMDTDDQTTLEVEWRRESEQMLRNGLSIIAKLPEIVEIEKKINFNFQGKTFVGYVDMIAKGSDGRYIYLDFKTSWNRPSDKDVDGDLQFILYSTALKEILGVDYYPTGYYVHLRSASVVRFDLNDAILKKTNERVAKNFGRLEKGLFFLNKGSPLCSYCDFYSQCYGAIKKWE